MVGACKHILVLKCILVIFMLLQYNMIRFLIEKYKSCLFLKIQFSNFWFCYGFETTITDFILDAY